MSRSLALAGALLCAAVASACSGESNSVGPGDDPEPMLRTERNPNGPGAFVIRFDDIFSFFFSDPDEQYSVIAGITPADLASLCAGGDFSFQPATTQLVFRPDGSLHLLFRAKDVSVLVFAGAFADFCADPPLAVGRGSFINTDNDVSVTLNRTNSFGFRLRGRVTDASGDTHHVLVKFRALIFRSGAFREVFSEIKLN